MGSKIFWHWAIAIISKNLWAINFGIVGNCPPPGYATEAVDNAYRIKKTTQINAEVK
jgi:hypothetical protein